MTIFVADPCAFCVLFDRQQELAQHTHTKMKFIDTKQIESILRNHTPSDEGAQPTSRCLPGQYPQENQQEWDDHVILTDGRKCRIVWIFENADCTSEDPGDYPWHQIDWIEIEEEEV